MTRRFLEMIYINPKVLQLIARSLLLVTVISNVLPAMHSAKEAPLQDETLVNINRRLYRSQEEFDGDFKKAQASQKPGFINRFKTYKFCDVNKSKKIGLNLIPILEWLPKYNWKTQFVGDLISGCTVAVMHIPQGMGYALLAGLSPIVGIYMAFIPVLVYCFFGTSHHISLGTFAVISLMTGKVIDKYASPDVGQHVNATMNATEAFHQSNSTDFSRLEVATAVCFMVGIWQLAMGIFKLGILGIILSEHLVSGFTTGAAIQVLVSQMKSLLGIKIPKSNGTFQVIQSLIAIFKALPTSSPAEVIISAITITLMAVHNDWIKPWYAKKLRYPLPVELVVLIVATVTTKYAYLSENYKVKTLEHIPTGLPVPQSPPFEILFKVAVDSIAIAAVSYAVSLSMAKIFGRRRGYKVRSNQELLAQGASNVVGSFFSCMPVAASLSRSMIQESVGGETQLANVISCTWLLFILLWIGPFFEPLPLSVLASIIIVALKGMFTQYRDFLSAWKVSRLDGLVWLASFLAVVIVDIDVGLGVGVIASVAVLLYRGHCPSHATLGRLPDTEIFVDIKAYPTAIEEPGIKIFRWVGAVQFANAETFRKILDHHVSIPHSTPDKFHHDKLMLAGQQTNSSSQSSAQLVSAATLVQLDGQDVTKIGYIIIDCSAVSYVDLSGTKCLTTLHSDLEKEGKTLLLAGSCAHLIEQLDKCQYFDKTPKENVFPSVLDAVMSVNDRRDTST